MGYFLKVRKLLFNLPFVFIKQRTIAQATPEYLPEKEVSRMLFRWNVRPEEIVRVLKTKLRFCGGLWCFGELIAPAVAY